MPKYRVEFTYQTSGYYELEAKNAGEAEDAADERFQNEEVPTYVPIEGSGIRIMGVKRV